MLLAAPRPACPPVGQLLAVGRHRICPRRRAPADSTFASTYELKKARAAVKSAGWKYLGGDGVMRLSPFKRAKSYEVFDKLTPHFATIGLTKEEAIQVKREFIACQERYDDCRERFLRGENVIWPAGTWAMVQFFGQTAEPG